MEKPTSRPNASHPVAWWQAAWRWLTQPPSNLPTAQHTRARMVSSLLVVLLGVLVFLFPFILAVPSFANTPLPSAVYGGMFLVLLTAYAISRTPHLNLAAWITVLITLAGTWAFAYIQRTNPVLLSLNLGFIVFPIFVSGLILSGRATTALAVLNIVGLIGLYLLEPDPTFRTNFTTVFTFISIGCLLIVVVTILRQRDQDQLQRQSRALAESEERFQLVSYATSDVVWDWDLVSDKIWWNQNVRRLLGARPVSVGDTATWWEAQIHPEDREKFDTSMRAAIARGEDFWSGEYRLRNFQGEYIHIFDRAYIMYDENRRAVRMVGAVMDISDRKRVEEALRELSVRDPLTGLFNRRYLEETLDRELWRAARNQKPVGIIMLDIDHFKQINDTRGHGAGDTVLRELGNFLGKHVRGSDIACRYGGEEFTVILPEATLAITQRRAEQLRQDVQTLSLRYGDDALAPLSLSLGVAAFPAHGLTGPQLLAAADAALYQAKQAGRNQVVVRETEPA